MTFALAIASLVMLALIPGVIIWLLAVIPMRRVEAPGLTVGNPIHQAPHTDAPGISYPLIDVSRRFAAAEMEGLLLGMRHLPVEHTAPLLGRFMRSTDPALQLYAQSILAQGRERLQASLNQLERQSPHDPRAAGWLLETGLRLAHPSLTGSAERPALLQTLARLATERLVTCPHTPSLLANAIPVFLAAGRAGDAQVLVDELPEDSPLRKQLEPAVVHALHQQHLA